MKDCYGKCDSDGNIFIDPDQGSKEMLKTLIHELIHALEFEYDLKIKHKLVYKLETAIYRLLKDNF